MSFLSNESALLKINNSNVNINSNRLNVSPQNSSYSQPSKLERSSVFDPIQQSQIKKTFLMEMTSYSKINNNSNTIILY